MKKKTIAAIFVVWTSSVGFLRSIYLLPKKKEKQPPKIGNGMWY